MNPLTSLSFLLFVKRRARAGEKIRQIRQCLTRLATTLPFELEVVDVREQPYLVEYFRLMATPALVRVSETGNQVLAGDDIVSQIEYWWPRWQQELKPLDLAPELLEAVTEDAAQGTPAVAAARPSNVEAMKVEPVATPSSTPEHPAGSTPTQEGSVINRSIDILRLSDEIFQLKQTQETLEAQLVFKDRIIAMMAHDLRNPLTAASIAIDTLEMGYNPDRAGTVPLRPKLTVQLLKNAKAQIRTIDKMITDILQTALHAGKAMRIQPQPTELRPLCLMALESVESTIKTKQQATEVDIPQDLPQIYADPEQIRRLLTNLMDNAVKYTPEHGVIKLTALHRMTQKIQISIQDTGPGIPESQQAQIFEEQFRLQRDQQQDGYGIGLALCRRIVQAHFGKIWVDSVLGEGSTFHVILPVYRTLGTEDGEPLL